MEQGYSSSSISSSERAYQMVKDALAKPPKEPIKKALDRIVETIRQANEAQKVTREQMLEQITI